jgi:hypothetical protein
VVTFLDGPAVGVQLQLRRIPLYLRVVHSGQRTWDALDQLDDEPKRNETIYVYRRDERQQPTKYHLCFRSRNKRASGVYWTCDYRFVAEQPADELVRSTEAWRAWVTEQLPPATILPFRAEAK